MEFLFIVYIVIICVGIGLIVAVFNISSHAAKHTLLLTYQLRMIAKIAKKNGVPEEEVDALMNEMVEKID